jgi:hypothetical protein
MRVEGGQKFQLVKLQISFQQVLGTLSNLLLSFRW